MKLGALDYVFKLKVTEETLVTMLDEVSREIEEEPSPSRKDSVDIKNIPAIKQRLLQTIIEKSYLSKDDILKEVEPLQLKVSLQEPFVLLYLSIDDFELKVFSDVIQEVQLLKFSMANILEEVLAKYFQCDVYGYTGGNLIAVLAQNQEYRQMQNSAKEAFEQAREYMKRYLNISVSGAVSGIYCGIQQVQDAVREVSSGLKSRLYCGGEYFYVSGVPKKSAKVMKTSYDGISSDLEKVISKKSDDLIRYLERFFNTAATLDGVQENDIRESYFEMYHGLSRCAAGYGIDINKLTDDQGSRLHYVILKGDTLTMIRESFLTVARKFLNLLQSEKKQIKRQDILQAQEYIRNNLVEHLTVTGVAEMLNMNGSYFSHLFKKQTGKSFVDYVNFVRIQKAKELLPQPITAFTKLRPWWVLTARIISAPCLKKSPGKIRTIIGSIKNGR